MSVDLHVQEILNIKKDIHAAIKEKGIDISNDEIFAEYPNEIRKITGGGSSTVSVSNFQCLNTTQNTIKKGERVFVNWMSSKFGDYHITGDYYWKFGNSSDGYLNKFYCLSLNGRYLYGCSSNGLQYAELKGLVPEYKVSNNAYASPLYNRIDKHGHIIKCPCRDNFSLSNGTDSPTRVDSTYFLFSNLRCSGDDSGAKCQSINFLENDIFMRGSTYVEEGEYIGQIFKVDIDSGKILKRWHTKESTDRNSVGSAICSITIKENGKLYLLDFYRSLIYTLSDNLEDNAEIEGSPIIGVPEAISFNIRPIGVTNDNNVIICYNNETTGVCLLQRVSLTEWKLLNVSELQNSWSDCYNLKETGSSALWNPTNQVLSLQYSSGSSFAEGNGLKYGWILKYYGLDENNTPIWRKVILHLPEVCKNWQYSYFTPVTFSADMSTACLLSNYTGSLNYDEKTNTDGGLLLIHQLTQVSLEIVGSDSSNLNSYAFQGIAMQDILPNELGKISTLEIEHVDVTINFNANNANITIDNGDL